ncbi:hypothetical protein [Psychrobacter sp. AOP3-A1-26]|uniref:hypothetical protein n=1 Tax=Psychrobacter sp. AOP3-A1-26 TaxID=3457700 RepID=UPI00403546FE
MKIALLTALVILISSVAHAESEIDETLKSMDIIDENYVYINTALAADFFRFLNDEQAQSSPKSTNKSIKIESVEMTPYFGHTSTTYTVPLTANEKSQLIQDLSSVEMLQNFCVATFIPYKYMAANNVTFSYLYYDQDGQPLTSIIMNNDTCHDALNQ